jgi:hypothetical protein
MINTNFTFDKNNNKNNNKKIKNFFRHVMSSIDNSSKLYEWVLNTFYLQNHLNSFYNTMNANHTI